MAFPATRHSPRPDCGQSRSPRSGGEDPEAPAEVGTGRLGRRAGAPRRKAPRPHPRPLEMQAKSPGLAGLRRGFWTELGSRLAQPQSRWVTRFLSHGAPGQGGGAAHTSTAGTLPQGRESAITPAPEGASSIQATRVMTEAVTPASPCPWCGPRCDARPEPPLWPPWGCGGGASHRAPHTPRPHLASPSTQHPAHSPKSHTPAWEVMLFHLL